MSAILDQFGRPATWGNLAEISRTTQRFSNAGNGDGDRPAVPVALKDIQKLIPPTDRKVLVAVSRYMIERWGPMKAIGIQIPMYSVGAAYKPTMNSTDRRVKTEAERVMREQFWPVSDLQSNRGMTPFIYDCVHCLIRDGEFFVLLTEYSTGFPAIQLIPSHRIGSVMDVGNRPVPVGSGPYKGAMIEDGVITNKSGTPIAYRFLSDPEDPSAYQDISARSMIHYFDSNYPEAKRGYPAMAHGLTDGRDSMQSHDWERMNMLIRSSILAVENTLDGVSKGDHPSDYFSETTPSAVTPRAGGTSKLIGGPARTITYQAGTGQKMELLKHDNPGEIYESFNDRCIRSICAGTPWPYSFVWMSTKQGTAERREIEQARRTVVDIQSGIDSVVRRITGYAYKKFVKLGLLEDSPDWWRWSFSKPPVLSIDPGRDVKATLDMHARGLISDDEVIASQGWEGSPAEYWESKFNAAAEKERAFIEAQAKFGVTLDPRVKGMFTPNDQPPVETTPVK